MVLEPVSEENPYDSLESPYVEQEPAIAVLSGDENYDEENALGEYTYHKHKNRTTDNSDEAEEKFSEIIAELDSVLSSQEDYAPFFVDEGRDSQPRTRDSQPRTRDSQLRTRDSQPRTRDSQPQTIEPEFHEPLVIEDRFDELDEFRDIASKLAPEEGGEGGVIREVKPAKNKPKTYSVPIEGVLAEYPDDRYSEIDEDTRKAARVLEVTLEEFKISAKVTGIKKGPVITMFELLPAPGVKISKITNLADNIALRLAASRVRIVAPIPGKHAVGIEVPNKKRAIVSFSEMVSAPEMNDQDMSVPIVLGKDIRGGTQVIDLTRTPHLLIAGATGSGKSVCVNALICSILYSRSPADVKMILVDPKIVELKLYNDIPHLLTPVITDPKKAIQAIQWCLYEMERRYALLDALGVREIRSYNKRIKERKLATTALPYLILVIDEFADLMATSGKELEAMIARLAAMSRAVGIHLVLATQRPSADVITGLIKANFPSRVAFMVASMMDSRIIIDSAGAEKLLGKGDMLFTSAWDPFPSRVQGAFMSEDEVERVVAYVKTLGAPEYIDDEIFIDDDENDEPSYSTGSSSDPLFNKALEIVASAGKASASYLQRRLKIGYNRAARLVEQMEDMGIVGPQNGSKPRDVIHMPDSSNF
jgi:S-DNA-T family DNA segregation ATPase FtsK/SpoIIIE